MSTVARSGTGGGRVGPWTLGDALAPGVFRATDAAGAELLVKVADPTPAGVERARREAAAHLALGGGDHPALVATAWVLDDEGGPVVATTWEPGRPLDVVVDGSPLPPDIVAALLAPVADALAWIHERGWVHGDVSAANVVVGTAGACLVDLGSARPVGAPPIGEANPATAAPEVRAGAPAHPAGDVWSLAVVVLHAAAGEPPTPGSPAEALAALEFPALLADVLVRALADDPVRRPCAAELADVLRAVAAPSLASLPVSDPAPPPRSERVTVDLGTRPPPRPPAPLAAWPFVVAAALVAVLAVVLGWVAG